MSGHPSAEILRKNCQVICPCHEENPVITTTYEDANLYHDYLTGRSVTGVLHLVNQTPIDWYGKRQATVEMATYGSEFNVARTTTEQIMDMRYTLRMLGVLILDSYMFSDNQGVHTNSTVLHSQLNKRHNALASTESARLLWRRL